MKPASDLIRSRAVLLAILALAGLTPKSEAASPAAVCKMDEALTTAEIATPQATARSFVEAALNGDMKIAYAMLTSVTRARISANDFTEEITFVRSIGPFEGLHPIHVYRVDMEQGSTVQDVTCGTPARNPDWARVAIAPVSMQYHLTLSARTINNDWAFYVWLVPSGKVWAVQDFNLNARTVGGRSASELLTQARQQRQAGNDFNAALLYKTGMYLAKANPAFELGINQAFQSDLAAFHEPPEVRSETPSNVTWNGIQFAIQSLNTMGIGSDLCLVISFTDPTWDGQDNAQAEVFGHRLIDAFRSAHPEYREVFPTIIARLLKADGTGGFTTVFDNKTGYAK